MRKQKEIEPCICGSLDHRKHPTVDSKGGPMKNKKRWFHIYVECHSTERFDVIASSEEEAEKLYEAGEADLEKDEVVSRDIIVIEGIGQEVA